MDLKTRVNVELAKATNYLIMGWWNNTVSYRISDAGIPVVKVEDGTSLGFSVYALEVASSTIGASPAGTGASQWKLVESTNFIYMLEAYIENLKVGRFESNIDGRRVIIDPDSRGITMKDQNNRILAHLAFFGNSWSELSFMSYYASGVIARRTTFSNNIGYYVQEFSTSGAQVSEIRYGFDGAILNSKLPNMSDATADSILQSGQWYRTGNIVKVKP